MSILSTAGFPEMSNSRTYAVLFALLCGCVDRAAGDPSEVYDQENDRRTRAEILADFCDLYTPCNPDVGFSENSGCERFFSVQVDSFDSAPAKQPHKCGQILLDIFACAPLADSCEDFESSISLIDGKSMRCEEPNARFHSLNCRA